MEIEMEILEKKYTLELTGLQFLILQKLNENYGEVVTKQEIDDLYSTFMDRNFRGRFNCKTHMSNIRKQIEKHGITIISIRGNGYALCEASDVQKAFESNHKSQRTKGFDMEWQPIDSLPENARVILTFDYESVYAGNREGHQFFDGSWEIPKALGWMPLPKPPEAKS